MSDDDQARTPLEQVVDLVVYLPVGVVFELPRSIPRFIDRGRRQVDQACAVGRQALRGLGVVAPAEEEPAPTGPPSLSVVSDHPGPPPGARPTPAARPALDDLADGPTGPAPDPETLAIPGYDSLSASQVVPRLEGLTGDELEVVRTYEQATRRRKTILSKIAQLQAS